jgi:hypothetical protein
MARELGPVPDEGWIGVQPVLAGEVIATALGYGTPKWSAHGPVRIASGFGPDRLSALPVLEGCFMGSFGFGSLTRLQLAP